MSNAIDHTREPFDKGPDARTESAFRGRSAPRTRTYKIGWWTAAAEVKEAEPGRIIASLDVPRAHELEPLLQIQVVSLNGRRI